MHLHNTPDGGTEEFTLTQQAACCCETCGAPVKAKRDGTPKHRYCSYACTGAAYRDRMRGDANPNYRSLPARQCVRCGADYQSYDKRRKYCSPSCYRATVLLTSEKAAAMSAKRAPVQRKAPEERTRRSNCASCGMVVVATEKRKYCPECRATKRAEQVARLTRVCRWCGETFLSRSRVTCSATCFTLHLQGRQRGEGSHLWRGGKTSAAMTIRNSREYGVWRSAVFERDNFTCQLCDVRGLRLTAHHIHRFATHPDLALEVWNGITLCWPCHSGIRGREEAMAPLFLAATGGEVCNVGQ